MPDAAQSALRVNCEQGEKGALKIQRALLFYLALL
jgi:hypothetical protein